METPLTQAMQPGRAPLELKAYEQAGGYQAWRHALLRMTPEAVREAVKESNLRGRGGAGFLTSLKWQFMMADPESRRPRYVIMNADEMEPGTFKDRRLLEETPHQAIEGLLISAYALQADTAFIFLRWAYRQAAKRLEKALAEVRSRGYVGRNILKSGYHLRVHLHVGAGRYMCGEESGLLNALEGKRATPRSKPPFPQTSGLWGRPTVVNNVETLCNVPHIVTHGPAWFRQLSRSPEEGGTKLYGVSGRVKKPGLWELPMGATAREIIEDRAGGMRDGLRLRGFLPGGASTDFLTEAHLDVPMDFDHLQKAGSRLGTGTMVLLDDHTCPVGMVLSLIRFFARESCGWCTPCREGLPWAEKLLARLEEGDGRTKDLELLDWLCRMMAPGRTFCALAPGAVEPLQSALKYFRADFEEHVRRQKCPWS